MSKCFIASTHFFALSFLRYAEYQNIVEACHHGSDSQGSKIDWSKNKEDCCYSAENHLKFMWDAVVDLKQTYDAES